MVREPTEAPGPAQSGSLDLFNGFNVFNGTGSYFAGFQAGYNYHVAVALSVSASRPTSRFPAPFGGIVDLRPRPRPARRAMRRRSVFRHAARPHRLRAKSRATHWLLYATGGFAWSYDQFTRTQIAGTPAAAPRCRARGESVRGAARSAASPAPASRCVAAALDGAARISVHRLRHIAASRFRPARSGSIPISPCSELRVGLNYQAQRRSESRAMPPSAPPTPSSTISDVHGQTTFIEQYAPPVPHALSRPEQPGSEPGPRNLGCDRVSRAMRLWQGAELWVNPEIDQGFGLEQDARRRRFPSGEAYKVGAAVPYARIQRALHPPDHRSRRRHAESRRRHQSVRRLADGQPAGDHGRQIQRRRHFRQQQICPRSAQ